MHTASGRPSFRRIKATRIVEPSAQARTSGNLDWGRSVMGRAVRLLPERSQHAGPSQWPREHKPRDVEALLEENFQLRELVVQLTKLVIKNIVDPKQHVG
jgi:hypothetical protein